MEKNEKKIIKKEKDDETLDGGSDGGGERGNIRNKYLQLVCNEGLFLE